MKERPNRYGYCQLLWWNWYWQIAAVTVSYFGETGIGKLLRLLSVTLVELVLENCCDYCQLLWWNWYWQITAIIVSYLCGTGVGKFTP